MLFACTTSSFTSSGSLSMIAHNVCPLNLDVVRPNVLPKFLACVCEPRPALRWRNGRTFERHIFPSRYTLLGPDRTTYSEPSSTSKLSFQLEHESWYCCSALRRKRRGHDCVTNKTHANPSLSKNIHRWNVERTTPAPQNKRAQTQRICGPENLRTQMLRVLQMEAATHQFKPARTSKR